MEKQTTRQKKVVLHSLLPRNWTAVPAGRAGLGWTCGLQPAPLARPWQVHTNAQGSGGHKAAGSLRSEASPLCPSGSVTAEVRTLWEMASAPARVQFLRAGPCLMDLCQAQEAPRSVLRAPGRMKGFQVPSWGHAAAPLTNTRLLNDCKGKFQKYKSRITQWDKKSFYLTIHSWNVSRERSCAILEMVKALSGQLGACFGCFIKLDILHNKPNSHIS